MVGGHGGCGQGGVGHGSRCSRGDGSEGGWYPGNVSGGSPEKNGRIKKDIEITNIPFKTHLIIKKTINLLILIKINKLIKRHNHHF